MASNLILPIDPFQIVVPHIVQHAVPMAAQVDCWEQPQCGDSTRSATLAIARRAAPCMHAQPLWGFVDRKWSQWHPCPTLVLLDRPCEVRPLAFGYWWSADHVVELWVLPVLALERLVQKCQNRLQLDGSASTYPTLGNHPLV